MTEELTLKNDIVFKIFFSKAGHEKYLKSFLEALLNIPIKKVEIVQEASLKQMSIKDKLGRLDIKATINDESIINIEMQMRNEHNIEKRSTYYGSRLISEQLSSSDRYEEVKPVILINILNYEFLEVPEYHTETVTVAKKHREYEIVRDIKYHFIELPKFRRQRPELANALECWLALIDYKDKELVKMAEEKETIIKEAKEDFEEVLSEGALKEIIEFRESAERDAASRRYWAEKKGMEEGMAKGMAKGSKNEKIKIAKKMLEENMNIKLIMQITELSKEEMEEIIKK